MIEPIHQFLTLVDVHGAVQTEATISAAAAQLVKHVESLRVIADEDDLVVGVLPDPGEHAVRG